MPVTVYDVAGEVLAYINSPVGHLQAAKWVSDRYRQIAARTRLRHLRQVGEISVPATITGGVVTIATGGKIVTGDAIAQAMWTPSQQGWHFKGQTAWYEVEAVQGSQLYLKTAYSETGVTVGAYTLARRWVPMDSTVRWLGDVMVLMRRRMWLERLTLDELDMLQPERNRRSGGAEVFVEVGDKADPVTGKVSKILEFYPYSSTAEIYHFVFWPVPFGLDQTGVDILQSSIPPEVDSHVLREGAIIDLMRWKMAEALDKGRVQEAAVWRNEYRTQETRWERVILDTFRADAGVDDKTFMLQRMGVSRISGDVRTAFDEVFVRGARP